MDAGLFSAAAGMIVKSFVQDIIGHNLANANTNGYKRERVIESDFARQLVEAYGIDGGRKSGSYVNSVVTDFSEGMMKETGNPLDFAIEGKGFFSVKDSKGNRYFTRDGAFRINQKGEIVTRDGLIVEGENGNSLKIPPEVGGSVSLENSLSVSSDGSVYVFVGNSQNKQLIGKIKVVEFDKVQNLERVGAGYYRDVNGIAGEKKAANSFIRQGVLESANFNMVQEMVEMIKNQRFYDSAQKVVKVIDKTIGDLFSVVG